MKFNETFLIIAFPLSLLIFFIISFALFLASQSNPEKMIKETSKNPPTNPSLSIGNRIFMKSQNRYGTIVGFAVINDVKYPMIELDKEQVFQTVFPEKDSMTDGK